MENLTKEQLRAQLVKIEQQERKELIKNEYHNFKKLEGTFWKTRNSYGDGKKWWYYTKITQIKPAHIYENSNGVTSRFIGYTFQTCTYKILTVEKEKTGYIHSLGKQISKAEFNAAWKKAMDGLTTL